MTGGNGGEAVILPADADMGIDPADPDFGDDDAPDHVTDLSGGDPLIVAHPEFDDHLPTLGGNGPLVTSGVGSPSKTMDVEPEFMDAVIQRPKDREYKPMDTSILGEFLESTDPEVRMVRTARGNQPVDAKLATFYKRIGDVMTDNAYDREVGGKRTGKIVASALHRVITGNGRIFSRKEERKGKRYNVLFIIDGSGSMDSGFVDEKGQMVWHPTRLNDKGNPIPLSRSIMAAELTRMMVDGLQRNHIDIGVLVFGRDMEILKPFRMTNPDLDDIQNRLENWCHGEKAGSTQVWQALHAGEAMFRGLDGHNIVITITDGQPNDCAATSWRNPRTGELRSAGLGLPTWWSGSVKRRMKEFPAARYQDDHFAPLRQYGQELSRRVDVVTIGIADSTVEQWAPNPKVVTSHTEFMDTILNTFRRFVTRG